MERFYTVNMNDGSAFRLSVDMDKPGAAVLLVSGSDNKLSFTPFTSGDGSITQIARRVADDQNLDGNVKDVVCDGIAKIDAAQLNIDDQIYAPWREYGDDRNLTGTVTERDTRRRTVKVRWNANGNVTPEGDISILAFGDSVEIATRAKTEIQLTMNQREIEATAKREVRAIIDSNAHLEHTTEAKAIVYLMTQAYLRGFSKGIESANEIYSKL